MAYNKQLFKPGDILKAQDLNDIEAGIVNNEQLIDDMKSQMYVNMSMNKDRVIGGSLFNFRNGSTYGNGNYQYEHIFYPVNVGATYYVTGSSASNVVDHPLGGFINSSGAILSTFGTDPLTVYTDYEIVAPENAAYMIVNRSLDTVVINVRTTFGVGEIVERVSEQLYALGDLTENVFIDAEEKVYNSLFDTHNGSTYGNYSAYSHAFYKVEEGETYLVDGASASNGSHYSLGCFLTDGSVTPFGKFGYDNDVVYYEYRIKVPTGATKMVINSNRQNVQIRVYKQLNLVDSIETGSAAYSAKTLDGVIYEAKKNPFAFKPFDKGYISFVFDDLPAEIDEIAATFEEYNMPLCLAAIPDRLGYTSSGLTENKGSFTVGMRRGDVCTVVQNNGGEILAHNNEVINITNQFDYKFMYEHFVTTRSLLETDGYVIRGIIRSGGEGQINKSAEIERWVTGCYEYGNYGYAPQHNLERITINQPISDLKAAIDDAVSNKKWIRVMAHNYAYDNGETFTSADDLRTILDYCKSSGIGVVTYAHMIDTFRSSELENRIAALENK